MVTDEFRVRRFARPNRNSIEKARALVAKRRRQGERGRNVPNELVKASAGDVPVVSGKAILPVLVERAGGAARFAWEEFACSL